MHFVRLQEEELPLATPVLSATSPQTQAPSCGNTQSKRIHTPQRSPDTQRRLKQKSSFSLKRTYISTGRKASSESFVSLPNEAVALSPSSPMLLTTPIKVGRIRPTRLQIADPYPSRLPTARLWQRKILHSDRRLSVLDGHSLHQATQKHKVNGSMILVS